MVAAFSPPLPCERPANYVPSLATRQGGGRCGAGSGPLATELLAELRHDTRHLGQGDLDIVHRLLFHHVLGREHAREAVPDVQQHSHCLPYMPVLLVAAVSAGARS